jgi:NAD(P)H-dependent FMN reductase
MEDEHMPTLTVIIGSTRPGRAGLPIAEWFVERARKHGGFRVEVADLAEIDLPLLDEPNHPRLRKYTKQHTRDWSARIERADAVVFVTPEYNYGYPAPTVVLRPVRVPSSSSRRCSPRCGWCRSSSR